MTRSAAADDGFTSRIWWAAADHFDKPALCLFHQSTGSDTSCALARYCGNCSFKPPISSGLFKNGIALTL